MSRVRIRNLSALLSLAVGMAACSKTPVTGRTQFNLIPDSVMIPLGKSSYSDMLSSARVESGSRDADTLKTVGQRIATVANQPKYKWRYSLIQDDETINAWCLPGGKIAFYTGILPVLSNEAGMAFVMGHEVGHATAHHGAERLSQQLAVLGGMAGLYLYMDKKTELSDEQKGTILAALGVGATLGVILPFSRAHEKEADVIGLMYMARAGYPPEESVKLWDRMDKLAGGSSLPTFLSTHPSNENRQANLRDWMSRAKKRYARHKRNDDTLSVRWK